MSDLRIGSLFSGYLGLDQAVESIFDARTVWTSDIDPGACKIIAHRYPDLPNLGDITAIDWTTVEPVDILTGGFPCQDLSMAGRRAGMRPGTRSGLWEHMAYAINQLRPRYVIAENVRGLLSGCAHSDLELCPGCVGDGPHRPVLRGLGRVLGDLADQGYDASWYGLRAADIGAPHGRFRVFILATDTRRSRWWRTHPGQCDLGRGHLPSSRRHEGPGSLVGGSGADLTLLPTPAAMNPNDGESFATWEERRQRTQERVQNGNGFGTPLSIAVQPEAGMFGQYTDAINRWQPIIGRPAPDPTINGRLSPRFVEWMMGLPDGWVTDVPNMRRAEQLKALGNGVVPQQAAAALQHMISLQAVAA